MARKGSKGSKETSEEILARWLAGNISPKGNLLDEVHDRWEAGMFVFLDIRGLHYEKVSFRSLDIDADGYVVIEWDDDGNVIVF
jgi:hypothetical protein